MDHEAFNTQRHRYDVLFLPPVPYNSSYRNFVDINTHTVAIPAYQRPCRFAMQYGYLGLSLRFSPGFALHCDLSPKPERQMSKPAQKIPRTPTAHPDGLFVGDRPAPAQKSYTTKITASF
jgi:hypothetical protein